VSNYRWVSIYFEKEEYEKLASIVKELERRGIKLSKYALLKTWIRRIFRKIEEGDSSWLELEQEENNNKMNNGNQRSAHQHQEGICRV